MYKTCCVFDSPVRVPLIINLLFHSCTLQWINEVLHVSLVLLTGRIISAMLMRLIYSLILFTLLLFLWMSSLVECFSERGQLPKFWLPNIIMKWMKSQCQEQPIWNSWVFFVFLSQSERAWECLWVLANEILEMAQSAHCFCIFPFSLFAAVHSVPAFCKGVRKCPKENCQYEFEQIYWE